MRKIVQITLLTLLAINFVYVASGAIHYPLQSIDVYSIWLFKAKAFFVEGGFPLETLRASKYIYSQPQYPLLFPWLASLAYRLQGGVMESSVLIIYPFLYMATLILAFISIRKINVSTTKALLFVYIYSMYSPLLAQGGRMHAGSADIYITIIYWVVVYSTLVLVKKNVYLLGWSLVVLTIVASQIKFEGLFLAGLLLFLPVERGKKATWIAISAIPLTIWMIVRVYLGIPASFGILIPGIALFTKKLLIVSFAVIEELLKIRNWYIFWILFGLVIYLERRSHETIKRIFQPGLLLILGLYICVYLFSTVDTYRYVFSSFDRVLLQVSPLFYLIFVDKVNKLFFEA